MVSQLQSILFIYNQLYNCLDKLACSYSSNKFVINILLTAHANLHKANTVHLITSKLITVQHSSWYLSSGVALSKVKLHGSSNKIHNLVKVSKLGNTSCILQ